MGLTPFQDSETSHAVEISVSLLPILLLIKF